MAWRPIGAGLIVCGLVLALALSEFAQSSSSPQTTVPSQARAQDDDQTTGIPNFRTESRQVIIEAEAWNPLDKKHSPDTSWMYPWLAGANSDSDATITAIRLNKLMPPPAPGLTAKDFHILENGVEQTINYFKEAEFPGVASMSLHLEWSLYPTTRGIWGWPFFPVMTLPGPPSATYLIGYVPPGLNPGECRTIKIILPKHYVLANRKEYCAVKDSDAEMTPENTKLAARMQSFANSTAPGKIVVFVGAFAFWSSGVLSLSRQAPSTGAEVALPAADFKYVVEVHDSKAPATVQIATQILLSNEIWKKSCPRNAALRILGTVYKLNGEVAAHFGDTYLCGSPAKDNPVWKEVDKTTAGYLIPTVFDTELNCDLENTRFACSLQTERTSAGRTRLCA